MSLHFNMADMAQSHMALDFRAGTVRPIGDILPLVFAKYGIDPLADPHEIPFDSAASAELEPALFG